MSSGEIENAFKLLGNNNYKITSYKNKLYNCIAWAASENFRKWWPDKKNQQVYWPLEAPLETTIKAFIAAFETRGYKCCDDDSFEDGYEKVALFALNGIPTHAARQLRNGKWTSKLGDEEDIEHFLRDVETPFYGTVVQFLKRPNQL